MDADIVRALGGAGARLEFQALSRRRKVRTRRSADVLRTYRRNKRERKATHGRAAGVTARFVVAPAAGRERLAERPSVAGSGERRRAPNFPCADDRRTMLGGAGAGAGASLDALDRDEAAPRRLEAAVLRPSGRGTGSTLSPPLRDRSKGRSQIDIRRGRGTGCGDVPVREGHPALGVERVVAVELLVLVERALLRDGSMGGRVVVGPRPADADAGKGISRGQKVSRRRRARPSSSGAARTLPSRPCRSPVRPRPCSTPGRARAEDESQRQQSLAGGQGRAKETHPVEVARLLLGAPAADGGKLGLAVQVGQRRRARGGRSKRQRRRARPLTEERDVGEAAGNRGTWGSEKGRGQPSRQRWRTHTTQRSDMAVDDGLSMSLSLRDTFLSLGLTRTCRRAAVWAGRRAPSGPVGYSSSRRRLGRGTMSICAWGVVV